MPRWRVHHGAAIIPPVKATAYLAAMSKAQPASRQHFPHFLAIPTRWLDNDVYNHVNNVNYYSFFDTVVNEYMLREGVLSMQTGPVCLVVETGCQYFSPISFPDIVNCGLRVAHLGTS